MSQELLRALDPLLSRVRTTDSAAFRNGNMLWTDEPLAREVMLEHLDGGTARGACPIERGGNTVRCAVMDLDSHKGEVPWEAMASSAQDIMKGLENIGLRPRAFRSRGGNGIHLIVLWDEPQDAWSVRVALRGVLNWYGYKDGAGGLVVNEVEVFPKQNSVSLDGRGSQFILPLAGKSVPLEPMLDLEPMPREYILSGEWRLSDPVPLAEQEQRVSRTGPVIGHEDLKALLDAIPNSGMHELDYDAWRNVIFAIHYETEGSDDGLLLAQEFTARSSKWVDGFLEERVWPYITNNQESPITVGTIKMLARQYGWVEPITTDDMPALASEHNPHDRSSYERDRSGDILATLGNLALALRDPVECGVVLAFDEFQDAVMIKDEVGVKLFGDVDNTKLRIRMEDIGFKPVGKELMRDAVDMVAHENRYDSLKMMVNSLKWDGVKRIETLCPVYFGTDDSEYTRAVGMYLMTALAGRALSPGIKADMVPILVGRQGVKKSSGVGALCLVQDWFRELNLHATEESLARKMRGAVLCEFGEMKGFRTAEKEAVKSFITRTHENWTPKFREYNTSFARRCIFIGTTNQHEFLDDDTGNRRYLPMIVEAVDIDALVRDREQLWAEAVAVFKERGIAWQRAEELGRYAHERHSLEDAWMDLIEAYLDRPGIDGRTPRQLPAIPVTQIAQEALRLNSDRMVGHNMSRIKACMEKLGYVQERQKDETGRKLRVWIKS